jgi:hypothetical protein
VNRRRGLVAAGLAGLVVAGMLWADAVALQRANPSFHREERNFSNLLQHGARTSVTTTTTSPQRPSTSTTPTRSGAPAG